MYLIALLHLDKIFMLAATTGSQCSKADVGGGSFLFLPHWWQYMQSSAFQLDTLGQCVPNFTFPNSLFPVSLAVLDILLRLAGFAAVIAVIASGVQYIMAQGNPEKAAGARKALYNALIGLGIVFTAVLFVAFIGNKLAS